MTRLAHLLPSLIVAAALLLLGRGLVLQAAPSLTPVCGTITTTTWTAAGSPYEVCLSGVTVNPGATLTIEPGATVQFQSGSRMIVRGALSALGTPAQTITFTGQIATPGSWQGVLVESLVTTPAVASLAHVALEYGGLNSSTGAQIQAFHGTLTMTHSLLRDGAGAGLYADGNSYVSVHDTQFLNHGRQALVLSQPENGLDLGGLLASGNSRDVVYVNSTTYYDDEQLWPNAGLPYVINGLLGTFEGGSLTIAPGSELRFTSLGRLYIRGELTALGLPGAPITLTGDVATPGHWDGLWLYGLTRPANAQLEYVTIEYGCRGISSGANILVDYGHLIARHIVVRYSQFDGVRFGSNGHGSVLSSQIFGNTVYGVNNAGTTWPVLATNNWWGHPSGPTHDVAACNTGQGDRISAGVIFRPVLTDTNTLNLFPLSDTPSLTLTPRRWFAPANNTTQVYFDITLRDGDGAPLPGRQVRLSSSLGAVTDGGITNADGHALAYLVSNTPGDAVVTAALEASGACEVALSPAATVTFTPPLNITDLFPDAPAPYMDGRIRVAPMPVVEGVPSTMAATLTNPLPVSITVDVNFGFAQASIGLAFGPIKDFTGVVISPTSSLELSADWIPPLSGHFCVQVRYTITAVGGVSLTEAEAGAGSGISQLNLEALPSTIATWLKKTYAKALGLTLTEVIPRGAALSSLHISFKGGTELGWHTTQDGIVFEADPPRQDYRQITQRRVFSVDPVQPGGGLSPERAAAINAVAASLAEVTSAMDAVALASDRFGGASAARDQAWAAQQANARLEFEKQLGAALLQYAGDLEALVLVLNNEGVTQALVSVSDVIAYQQRLATQGFTAEEIEAGHQAGLTDAEIEALRQAIIAADPNEVAGDVIASYLSVAAAARAFGQELLNPTTFRPGLSVGGSPGLQSVTRDAQGAGNSLAQVGNTVSTFQLGNPLTQTAVIDLRARRIDLPADWTVSVSPIQATLAPGEQITVTVSILSGSLVPQGTIPRAAVEAYAGSQLLGGVTFDVVVPAYVVPFGVNDLYLPLVIR